MKEEGKAYNVHTIRNDLSLFPEQVYFSSYFFNCIHEVYYKDYWVDVIIPGFYFKNKDTDEMYVEGLGTIKSEDNPIVVLMKKKTSLLPVFQKKGN